MDGFVLSWCYGDLVRKVGVSLRLALCAISLAWEDPNNHVHSTTVVGLLRFILGHFPVNVWNVDSSLVACFEVQRVINIFGCSAWSHVSENGFVVWKRRKLERCWACLAWVFCVYKSTSDLPRDRFWVVNVHKQIIARKIAVITRKKPKWVEMSAIAKFEQLLDSCPGVVSPPSTSTLVDLVKGRCDELKGMVAQTIIWQNKAQFYSFALGAHKRVGVGWINQSRDLFPTIWKYLSTNEEKAGPFIVTFATHGRFVVYPFQHHQGVRLS